MSDYRIALRPDDPADPCGRLDDVVVRDVSMFRAEMMSDTSLWMCCYFPDSDERLTFWIQATKRRGQKMQLEVRAEETPHSDRFTYEADR